MRFRPCKNCDCMNLIPEDSPRRYCKDACKQKAYRDRKEKIMKNKKVAVTKFCPNCGKKFETTNYKKQFCKQTCQNSYWQYRQKQDEKGDQTDE